MVDSFFGINTQDPEVESSVQANATTTTSTDIEVRVTNNDIGISGQKLRRQEVSRKLRIIAEYIESGFNVTWPMN